MGDHKKNVKTVKATFLIAGWDEECYNSGNKTIIGGVLIGNKNMCFHVKEKSTTSFFTRIETRKMD